MTTEDDDLVLTPAGIDPDPSLSISALLKLWNISKPTLYNYFKTLSITPVRQGRAAYVTNEQRELVNLLIHQLRKNKNTSIEEAVRSIRAMGIYVRPTVIEPDGEVVSKTRAIINKRPDDLTAEQTEALIENMNVESQGAGLISQFWDMGISRLAPFFARQPEPVDPLQDYEMLDRIYEKGWELPTSRLAAILQLAPATIGSMNEFERLGFHFKKVGKTGREASWSVTKIKR
jgi:hypothetical protein